MQRAAVFVSAVVLALMVGVPALAQSDTVEEVVGVVVADESAEAASPEQHFATLGGVSAVPMASAELEEIKGQHIHFFTASGIHLVNPTEQKLFDNDGNPNNLDVGFGYKGICVATSVSSGGVSGATPCP